MIKKLKQSNFAKKALHIPVVMGSVNHYTIGCDPYDKLNWFQALLKKTGLFYRNRPKSSVGILKWKEEGSVEFVKHCP